MPIFIIYGTANDFWNSRYQRHGNNSLYIPKFYNSIDWHYRTTKNSKREALNIYLLWNKLRFTFKSFFCSKLVQQQKYPTCMHYVGSIDNAA
jgi:hypothetical protein